MKKIKFFVIICSTFVSLLFFACNKSIISDSDSFELDAKFENIYSLNQEDRKLVFRSLLENEKSNFWKYFTMKEISKSQSFKEKTLLKEIFIQLTPEVFNSKTKEFVIFTTLIIPKWLQKSEPVFGKNKIAEMFYFIEPTRNSIVNSPNTKTNNLKSLMAPPPCICNLGSSYTCKTSETTIGTGGVSHTTKYGTCESSQSNTPCDDSSMGCGFAALWSCNGNHCEN